MSFLAQLSNSVTRALHKYHLWEFLAKLASVMDSIAPSVPEVANVAALAAVDPTTLADGARIWVQSLQSYFEWVGGSATAADSITIVAPTVTPTLGRWFRQPDGSREWLTSQTSPQVWFINATSGSDENSGAPGHPLKTWSEFRRRMVGKTPITGVLTVEIQTSLPATDPFILDLTLDQRAVLNIQGTATVIATGSINVAFTARAPATNTPGNIQTTMVADWAPYIASAGFMVQATSGAAIGAVAWPMKRVAAQNLNVSTWWEGGEAFPGLNDGIQLLQIPSVRAFSVENHGSRVTITNLLLDTVGTDWPGGTTDIPGSVRADSNVLGISGLTFVRCSFTRPMQNIGRVEYQNCQFMGDATWTGNSYSVFSGGGFVNHVFSFNTNEVLFERGAQAQFLDGTYVEGLQLSARFGSILDGIDVAVFDANGADKAGIVLSASSYLIAGTTWGSGTEWGVLIDKNSGVSCSGVNQTITGTTSDLSLRGTTNFAWAAARPNKTEVTTGATDSMGYSV